MSTYELDESDVMIILQRLRDGTGNMAREVADRLEAQIPIPIPAKIGAVVRTDQNNCFIRWAYDAHTHEPWIAHSTLDGTYRTDEIGRIAEVLSPGVDL